MRGLKIEVASLSDVGRKRTLNEDAFGFFQVNPEEVLAIVADGMGGHASGEIASRMAVDIIQEVYSKERGEKDILEALKSAFQVANFTILQKSLEREDLNGMGTTATVLVLKDNEAFVGHMGDSRAYLSRDSEISQLTKDHSMVNRLVEQGHLSREEALRHPQRNVIYKTLGVNMDSDLQLIGPTPTGGHDIFLLCSDGLTNLVSDQELLEIIKKDPPQKASENLVHLANQRGGHDNITVQVLKLGPGKEPSSSRLKGKSWLYVLSALLLILFLVNLIFLLDPELQEKVEKGIGAILK